MKNLLKKLHIMPNQSEATEGSTSSKTGKSTDISSPEARSNHSTEHNKPFSGLSTWLNSVANKHNPSPPSSSNVTGADKMELSDSVSSSGLDVPLDSATGSSNSRDPDIEEFQIQLALELSAKEDPEAVQIEAVKQISLGSCAVENTPAEVVAYRYWNYNALGYDDKIMDGFYDLYGVMIESTSEKMPSLVDLQGTPVSDGVTWEAVLVNRAADANLLKLEERALVMALESRSESVTSVSSTLVQKLAVLVADNMGGPVGDPDKMLRVWQGRSYSLKATLGSMVLPLGSLEVGLARHRALLFKVLADSVGVPCRLVKGQQYTGSDDVAMNFVKINDGREYIVDLMADPGTLIPSDAAGSHIEYDESLFSASPLPRDIDSPRMASSSSGVASSSEEQSESGTLDKKSRFRSFVSAENEVTECANLIAPTRGEEERKVCSDELRRPSNPDKVLVQELPSKPNYPYSHARSPSWTEGVSSPAARRMKVKDVSQYMIDAAKENPHLAQKLHDVLLESGVVAPPNLFTEIYSEHAQGIEVKTATEEKDANKMGLGSQKTEDGARFLPPLPQHRVNAKAIHFSNEPDHAKHELREITGLSEVSPIRYSKNVPVAAAAAAAAAVVASSMVAAASKASTDTIPVAAAATATAAAVVATTAAVSKQYEQGIRNDGDTGASGSGDKCDAIGTNSEGERISNKSTGNESTRSDVTLDEVAECEIPWEDISLGERIGLGSYGEVYRGDWHGTAFVRVTTTVVGFWEISSIYFYFGAYSFNRVVIEVTQEVAVKRFLDQDITGESLEEFRSEVRIMKRVRHPNVVLFMGAVTRAPNLSIITEFLPRGSLYRLLHRPNNQLDERRRLRMALDAARGMNYLHNCTPVIVHRDLKSPNLLVDKNWVVKVCDFGLSRMKHSTFLSSRSTAGTAEWMAPEVLRNEPSNEKCDVYSFGVILWELSTLKQPWGGMNPMQVVGAVGFQHRRLDIPDDMDPVVADIIQKCWQTDPRLRPTFAEIMAALKPLQKPITSSHAPRPNQRAVDG